jgi:hypothetical protein
METLQLILFEYLLGYGLQAFIFIFGIYTFNRQKIEIKKYLLASIIVAAISFLVRQLPISFGVHTIFDLLASIIICILLLKMPAINTIRSMSIVFILLLASETAGLVVLSIIIGKDKLENIMNNPLQKAITSVPLNIFFLLLVALSYYILKKKGDSNRKVSS